MKTIIFSLLAVCMSIGLFAFANPVKEDKSATSGKASGKVATRIIIDPDTGKPIEITQQRERWCSTLSMSAQMGSRSSLYNPTYYTQTGCPEQDCLGTVAVCAIYAYRNFTTNKPIINASIDSTLYNQLTDWVVDGVWDYLHDLIELKSE